MSDAKNTYQSLRSKETLNGLTDEQALEHIGYLTDLSLDLREKEGLEHAVRLSNELQRRDVSPEHRALSHYFLGNAWSNLRLLADRERWDWEQPELAHETFHFRMALHEEHVSELIDKLVVQSREQGDLATENFLQFFVQEQVEEEAAADRIVQQLKLAGDNGAALLLLDRELAARQPAP